ncbi:hypothetical protein CEXT_587441 [Caerostris extrusa]|uniref:Uncharacterized protein n=1 Tax=Caerostris extrusa TaxID=172846 RepID=A0AAV4Y5F5_CAEEX|nr:hypothetical protein CEXT_587441 [Caerostris extrusa]
MVLHQRQVWVKDTRTNLKLGEEFQVFSSDIYSTKKTNKYLVERRKLCSSTVTRELSDDEQLQRLKTKIQITTRNKTAFLWSLATGSVEPCS